MLMLIMTLDLMTGAISSVRSGRPIAMAFSFSFSFSAQTFQHNDTIATRFPSGLKWAHPFSAVQRGLFKVTDSEPAAQRESGAVELSQGSEGTGDGGGDGRNDSSFME